MSSSPHSIAIVGGGFSGAALSAWLLEEGGRNLTIHVIEERPRLGWGIAYGDAHPHHILNVVAERMSLWVDRPHDFLNWARENGPHLGWPDAETASGHTYLPRRLYGHYVEARLAEVRAGAAARLNHHRTRAVSVTRAGTGFTLGLANGDTLYADSVVLATGFDSPAFPFRVEGKGSALITDPWTPEALAHIRAEDEVLLIGTGLTMIDIVHSLLAAGHRGGITAISRHGLIPRVHGDFTEVPPVLTEDDVGHGLSHCLHKLRGAVRTGGLDWRSAVESLRGFVNPAWRIMSPDQRARYLRHARPYWEVHRHRVPAQSADTLLGLLSAGRLHIEAARVHALYPSDGEVSVTLRPRGRDRHDVRRYDRVINCIQPASLSEGRLEHGLIRSGLGRSSQTGEGLVLDHHGRVVDSGGSPVAGLFTIGPIRRVHGPDTTAVPHIRPQLLTLVPLLLERPAQAISP